MKKFALCSLLALSSCSVVVKAPLTRFESPETRGKAHGFEAQWAYQARTDVQLTRDFATTAPDMVNPFINEDPGHRLMAAGAFAVLDRLDIGLSVPDARLGLKYQILGDGKETAKQGNIPLSVVAGISKRSEDETQSAFLSPSTTATYKLKETQADVGIILGYRIDQTVLLYGGLYYLWDNLKTQYSNPSTAPSVDNTGIMKVYNFNFGVQKNFETELKFFFRGEFSISQTSLGRQKDTAVTYGLAGGAFF